MISGIFRSTIWNQTIPDRLRGRLAGIEQVSYSTGPLLGDSRPGSSARWRAYALHRVGRRALYRRSGGGARSFQPSGATTPARSCRSRRRHERPPEAFCAEDESPAFVEGGKTSSTRTT